MRLFSLLPLLFLFASVGAHAQSAPPKAESDSAAGTETTASTTSQKATPTVPAGMVRSLVVTQSANGLPNQPSTERVLQMLHVSEDRLRLDDLQGGVVYLLELVNGEPELKEVSKDGRHYRESDELGELQRSRDRSERQILDRLKSAPELERKSVMEKLHLRPKLEREVVVVRTGEKKKILERDTERVMVKENGRTIVDVWLASSEGIDIPFFHFYSKLGAFLGGGATETRRTRRAASRSGVHGGDGDPDLQDQRERDRRRGAERSAL